MIRTTHFFRSTIITGPTLMPGDIAATLGALRAQTPAQRAGDVAAMDARIEQAAQEAEMTETTLTDEAIAPMSDEDLIWRAVQIEAQKWHPLHSQNALARALRELVARRAAPAADNWRDDPAADERWCAGNEFALNRLCAVLKVDPDTVDWDGSDGSLQEEADALIWRILHANPDAAPATDDLRAAAEPIASLANVRPFGEGSACVPVKLDLLRALAAALRDAQPAAPCADADLRAQRDNLARMLGDTVCYGCNQRISSEQPRHYVCVSCSEKRKYLAAIPAHHGGA